MKKMKKILFILIALFAVASCNKNLDPDLTFGELPEKRMAERNAELQNKLLESANGWKAFLRTSLRGGAYSYYMQFNDKNEVNMLADWSNTTAVDFKASTYRIKYVMNTSLIFDTYNYLTILQDPNASANGGTNANGLQSDIEFEYLRSTQDSIILKGKKYGNNLYLVKASAAEKASFENGGYLTSINKFKNYLTTRKTNYIEVSNGATMQKLQLNFNVGEKTFTGQSIFANDSIASVKSGFAYSINGAYIVEKMRFLNVSFKEIINKAENTMVLLDSAGKEYPILENPIPLIPLKILFGYNKTFKGIIINGQLPLGVTSDFNTIFNGMVNRFRNTGRTIESVEFRLTNPNTAVINIWYISGTTRFLADASFNYTYNDDIITLTNYKPALSNANWTTRINEIGNFIDWFRNDASFKVDWVSSTNANVSGLGGLYKVNNTASFFYGTTNP